jgi:hypothetical protein
MARPLAECGTWAAYKRHLRKKEEVDEACAEAARVQRREQHAREDGRDALMSELAKGNEADTEKVSQLVSYGQFEDVAVPVHEDALESARWRLRRVRAAMLVAGPRDVAPLAKAEQEVVAEIARLSKPVGAEEKKVSALDQLANKRAERLAKATG